jgi:hypothetical protein
LGAESSAPYSLIDLNACVYSVSLILSFAKLFVRLFPFWGLLQRRESLTVTTSVIRSEDVAAFSVYVAGVVERGGVHHREARVDSLPDACLHVLAVLHRVLVHLFDVLVFGRSSVTADAFVVSGVQRIRILERAEKWLLFDISFLFWEGDVGAVGGETRVEGASLPHGVAKGLFAVNDLSVLACVFFTALVLSTLVGVFRVSHLVLVCERFGLDSGAETRRSLRCGTSGRS